MFFVNYFLKYNFSVYSSQTITIKKTFFNRKKKAITYNADIWMRAEKFFPIVGEAHMKGNNVKLNVKGDMFLSSNLWGEYQKRYTGIHEFNSMGGVKPLTGVNLDEREWCTLVTNFSAIKDYLSGKKVDLSKTSMLADEVETVKMFIAEWVLNGEVMDEVQKPKECYTKDAAMFDAHQRKPQPGNHFDEKAGQPEVRIRCICQQPPEDTELMYLVLLEIMEKKILDEAKVNCEACQVKSDSQFDHCQTGNCLDETTDHLSLYCANARKKVQVNELMIVFDNVRVEMGVETCFFEAAG